MKDLFCPFIVAFALTIPALAEGPSFIPIEKCPSVSKKLIAELKIDSKKVHSCITRSENIFGTANKIDVVHLTFDDPDDCIAGCIYKTFTAIAESGSGTARFWHVPEKSQPLNLKDLPEYSNKSNRQDFSCESDGVDIQELVNKSYGKFEGQWGLYLELKKPLVCTWIETVSTIYPKNYSRSLNKGFKARGEWSGFGFFKIGSAKPGQDATDSIAKFKYKESRLQPIEWEEHHK